MNQDNQRGGKDRDSPGRRLIGNDGGTIFRGKCVGPSHPLLQWVWARPCRPQGKGTRAAMASGQKHETRGKVGARIR